MARTEKYRVIFNNVDGINCRIRMLFEGWGGSVTELTGGAKPFVLGEFNNDEDYFKPVRPQQATMEIVAQAGVVSMDDFLADNDTDILVIFDFGDFTNYWQGYLSQDDLQETWIDTIHILTLRATEGLGELKEVPFTDDAGALLIGRYTPLQLIQYATDSTALGWTDYKIVSNLFHTSMTDALTDTGLDQCYVDARTFESQPNVFDDAYTVLEKINRAWSQTIFQYRGEWWIFRQEERFLFPNLELNVIDANPLSFPTRTAEQTRYDISVGQGENVRLIVPQAIKYARKPSKTTTITYNWENFEEIVCNESFQRGELVSETLPLETYTVDSWDHFQGSNIGTPTASTGTFLRNVEFTDGKIQDNYVTFFSGAQDDFIRSCKVYVNENDYMGISFQHRYKNNTSSASNITTAYVLLIGDDGGYYTLNDDGSWNVSNSSFTSGVTNLAASYAIGQDWQTYEITETDQIPEAGYLYIILYKVASTGFQVEKQFKDLKVDITPAIQKLKNREIVSDYDTYTIAKNNTNAFNDTIYLDDADSKNHKGAIFESDGITLTGDQWYRRRYDTERFTFKRHNAIANWFLNRDYKIKLDCTFRGLIWEKEGIEYPIGLVNTINFVDDAPDKTFAITNLKEIDFMAGTWTASLLEIYDTDNTDDVPGETDVHTFGYNYENKS